MTDTVNLGLPYIDAAQAQKHVTHNEALRVLDALVQLAVLDRDLAAPPASPGEGQRWIVAASPSEGWSGHATHVATWQDGGWRFGVPKTGWIAYVVDEGTLLVWNGSAWADFFATVTSIQNLARLGIGTTADAANPLSAKLNNALWVAKTVAEGGDGNLRYKLSKESAAKTLSLLLQDNFSGRAEIGLTGDDDLHVKVSADGLVWREALSFNRNTGKAIFPSGIAGLREQLTADRTYYVRTDGSDSNDGLANTAAGAFLTIQKAVNAAAAIDLSIHNVTIQVANGTFNEAVALKTLIGSGTVTIQGDTAAPGNVVVNSAGNCFTATNIGGDWVVKGFKLVSGFVALDADGPNVSLSYGVMEFSTAAVSHTRVQSGAKMFAIANYSITGGAGFHLLASFGQLIAAGRTVTLIGDPAFSSAFAYAEGLGYVRAFSMAFSGAATGKRYDAIQGSLIQTNGGGANYFPGNVAGTTSTNGQYI